MMKAKRSLLAVAAAGSLACAAPATAAARPFHRYCGTPQTGFVLGPEDANYNMPYEVTGPWRIDMAPIFADRLARRYPPLEFGYRVSATKDIPCWTADAVTTAAAHSWLHWHGNSGFTTAKTTGMGPALYIGRFWCDGTDYGDQSTTEVVEECHNRLRTVRVGFQITDNPYYP